MRVEGRALKWGVSCTRPALTACHVAQFGPPLLSGLTRRLRSRFGSKENLTTLAEPPRESDFDGLRQRSLVKRVMETSGGDNAQFARKYHARFDA